MFSGSTVGRRTSHSSNSTPVSSRWLPEIPDIPDRSATMNVRFGLEADICTAKRHVHFALGAFSGSRAFNTLPRALRRDVRHFFGSFGAAQSEARQFLFSLGTHGTVEEACASAVQACLIHVLEQGRYH